MQLLAQQQQERQRLIERREVLEAQIRESRLRTASYQIAAGSQPLPSSTPPPPPPRVESSEPPRPLQPPQGQPSTGRGERREDPPPSGVEVRRPAEGRGRRPVSPRTWASEVEDEERDRSPVLTRSRDRHLPVRTRSISEARSEAEFRRRRDDSRGRRGASGRGRGRGRVSGNLQDLLSSRPAHHPSDADLAKLAPLGYLKVKGEVTYFKNRSGQLVVLGQDTHHADLTAGEHGNILHQYSPIMSVGNPYDRDSFMEPTPGTKAPLLKIDRLFLPVTPKPCSEHGHQACHCPSPTADPQQMAFLPPLCLMRGYCKKEDAAVQGVSPTDKTWPNFSRFYSHSSKTNRPVLQQPQPFLSSWRWAPKAYLPANAGEGPGPRSAIFYTMFDKDRYQEIVRPYTQVPNSWNSSLHPWGSEPKGEELELWARKLYGSETLLRVLYPAHPGRSQALPIHSATGRGMRVPVIQAVGMTTVQDFLSRVLYPF